MCSKNEHIETREFCHLILEDGKASQLAEAHVASCDDCFKIVEELKGHINSLAHQKMPGI